MTVLLTTTVLAMPARAAVDDRAANEKDLKAYRMAAEVVVRPVSFGLLVLGSAAFVLTLPFSALGGNVGEAADSLVVGPFDATFRRCLGCTEREF
ncbi:multidrug transporter [Aestuariirhabdus litorea]|uniref:Multidrug transporter n=1 Tax=Aestuariirhabdus litorea TaxID=2528527 RepID=A0A3P3VIX3_9GAMM|nr:multidrug transporter [Aestuariirhabdus litorea]RRJ82675.1 multidrug transporter [Aestuariirhabdus litorea]RWW92835.1 multidrug transporter [Endozoicomonadaceae bacterium GTF-13]